MHFVLKRLSFLLILCLVLASCSTTFTPQETRTAVYYVASVEIDGTMSQADIENQYGGKTILYQPDAGFAVLGLSKEEGELTTLATSLNQDAFASPEVSASGHSAWANGFSAWAGGFSAWADGWSAWANGADLPAAPKENQNIWDQINLEAGHLNSKTFGEGITVAVIDTGIDLDHPLFQGRLSPKSSWKDYVDNDSYPMERGAGVAFGHGTGVAGLVLQVAPKATIMPIRVLENDGKGDLDDVISAIDWAVRNGADIINLSLGSNEYSNALDWALYYALRENVVTVASTGNDGQNVATQPARLTFNNLKGYIYGISSLNASGLPSSFANQGEGTYAYAPGEAVISAYPGKRLAALTGTSFAAPLFSGALALAMADYPEITGNDLYYQLMSGTNRQVFWNTDKAFSGYGSLDLEKFMGALRLKNGGFETGNVSGWNWSSNAGTIKNNLISGHYNLRIASNHSTGGVSQIITGLEPNTLYKFQAYVRTDGSAKASLGVKGHGYSEYSHQVATKGNYWNPWITFRTGPNSTSAEIYFKKDSGYSDVLADEFILTKLE